MKFVECAYCGDHINEGDDCYTNICGDAFCNSECVKNFYCSDLNYGHVWSDVNDDLEWHDDESKGEK